MPHVKPDPIFSQLVTAVPVFRVLSRLLSNLLRLPIMPFKIRSMSDSRGLVRSNGTWIAYLRRQRGTVRPIGRINLPVLTV